MLVSFSHTASANKLDRIIKKSAETWLIGVDWRLWRSQIQQESAFNCNATSPVGAMGCAQIMPGTMRDISKQSGIMGNPYDPEIGINAGAFYMSRMRAVFKAERPEAEKHNLAMASYNAGVGNVVKAQALAGNPKEWQPVADKLHLVTGKHSKETIDYVAKIRSYYNRALLTGVK